MKLVSNAAERNSPFIFEVLDSLLAPGAKVFECASGTGQHGHFVCSRRPDITWQPSDLDPEALVSIGAWQSEGPLLNMLSPIVFDVSSRPEALHAQSQDALVAINMIHISPWEACLGLLEQARSLLKPGGYLYLYGPFIVSGVVTAASNLAFDQSLRERDKRWGIRELDRVIAEASIRDLVLLKTVSMPANNLSVILQKSR